MWLSRKSNPYCRKNLRKLKKLTNFPLEFFFGVLQISCGLKIMDYLIVKLVLVFLIAGVVSCKLTEFVKWQTIGFKNVPSECRNSWRSYFCFNYMGIIYAPKTKLERLLKIYNNFI